MHEKRFNGLRVVHGREKETKTAGQSAPRPRSAAKGPAAAAGAAAQVSTASAAADPVKEPGGRGTGRPGSRV